MRLGTEAGRTTGRGVGRPPATIAVTLMDWTREPVHRHPIARPVGKAEALNNRRPAWPSRHAPLGQDSDGAITGASLDLADVGAIQPGLRSQILLG